MDDTEAKIFIETKKKNRSGEIVKQSCMEHIRMC